MDRTMQDKAIPLSSVHPSNSLSVSGCCWSDPSSAVGACASAWFRRVRRLGGGEGLSWAGYMGSSSHLALALAFALSITTGIS